MLFQMMIHNSPQPFSHVMYSHVLWHCSIMWKPHITESQWAWTSIIIWMMLGAILQKWPLGPLFQGRKMNNSQVEEHQQKAEHHIRVTIPVKVTPPGKVESHITVIFLLRPLPGDLTWSGVISHQHHVASFLMLMLLLVLNLRGVQQVRHHSQKTAHLPIISGQKIFIISWMIAMVWNFLSPFWIRNLVHIH